jgi:hypothetical protein
MAWNWRTKQTSKPAVHEIFVNYFTCLKRTHTSCLCLVNDLDHLDGPLPNSQSCNRQTSKLTHRAQTPVNEAFIYLSFPPISHRSTYLVDATRYTDVVHCLATTQTATMAGEDLASLGSAERCVSKSSHFQAYLGRRRDRSINRFNRYCKDRSDQLRTTD